MLLPHRKTTQEFKQQQFLNRQDKYKRLINTGQVPLSHQSRVVIPCLSKTYGFKTNQYRVNQKHLKGVISEKDFNDFVRKANQIVQKELLNKSAEETQPFFKITGVLLKVCAAVLTLAILLLALVVYSSIEGYAANVLLYFSLLLFIVSGLIAGVCPLVLHNSSYKAKDYESIIAEKLQQLLSQENQSNQSRNIDHITWNLQPNYYWIELHIRSPIQHQDALH